MPRNAFVLAISAAILVATFLADRVLPLGYAVWTAYLAAVGITLFQDRSEAPWWIAAVAVPSIALGYWVSPPGVLPGMAIANRSIASFGCLFIAWIVWRNLRARAQLAEAGWLQRTQIAVAGALMGEQTPAQLAAGALRVVGDALGAPVGIVHRVDAGMLEPLASRGVASGPAPRRVADGLPGDAVRSGGVVEAGALPPSHLQLVSGLGSSQPATVLAAALRAEGTTVGVLELGFFGRGPDARQRELLERARDVIGLALRAATLRETTQLLLQETQAQAEELQAQQEELAAANDGLRASQAQLQAQQAELEESNASLEEQTTELERREEQLMQVRDALQANAVRLEAASRYKSEFLANMSHELRTPLNSSLILARLLADNRGGRLSDEEVGYARAILDANNDLLTLINDVLDLAKIEAGHLQVHVEPLALRPLCDRLRQAFEPQARQKGLALSFEVDAAVPPHVDTDGQRLQQILKNLLANALKFTEQGEVALRVDLADPRTLRLAVRDTGIGIAEDKQQLIFEAFRQADGGTSRRHGGTGLGLSISRELAQRLGGRLSVRSAPGDGSTFTLELPLEAPAASRAAPTLPRRASEAVRTAAPGARDAAPPAPGRVAAAPTMPADAGRAPGETAAADAGTAARAAAEPAPADDARLLLVVEDDARFAALVRQVGVERGFEVVVAPTAGEASAFARRRVPSAVLLDIGLPDGSGLAVLDQLKRDARTRHVPVHIVSVEERLAPALEMGAIGHLVKPVRREQLADMLRDIETRLRRSVRRLLLVEDDAQLRESLTRLLAADDVELVSVGRVADALAALGSQHFDCMVTDLALPDGSGFELLETMATQEAVAFPPAIVYTGRALTRDEEQRLRRVSNAIIVKGARSPERLLDEVTLFLHSVEADLPTDRQRLLRMARSRDAVLEGRRILLAEDDVRNVFALANVFEPLGVQLEIARNGRDAVERVARGDIDLVLMDVMMPVMDGLDAMREIRRARGPAELPIVAITAKAMPEDRARCLAAGANDYLPKPIDVDKLLSLCRVWCPK